MGSNRPILVKAPELFVEHIGHTNGDLNFNPCDATDILLVKNSEARVSVGGISYSLSDGELVFLPGKQYGISISDKSAAITRFRLDKFLYSGNHENFWPFADSEAVFSGGVATANIAAVMRHIEYELAEKLFGYDRSVQKLLEYLMILLERSLSLSGNNSHSAQDLPERIKSYIDANYENNITLSTLAESLFVSPFHISHVFKEQFEISPIQYLINVRIKVACELLSQTNHPVSEVSLMVGYPNVNYFHILFKRFTGVSPGGFRRAHKHKK